MPRLSLPRLHSLALLTLGLCLSPLSDAQTVTASAPRQPDILHLNTETVVLEVVVTNPAGQPVPSLRAQDFNLTEDGVPQSITSFDEHIVATPAPAQSPTHLSAADTAQPAPAPAGLANILLIDSLNTFPEDQNQVRAQLIAYLRKSIPGTPTAVFLLESKLRLIHGFTTDPATLLAAIQDKKTGFRPHPTPITRTTQNDGFQDQLPETLSSMVPVQEGQDRRILRDASIAGIKQTQQDRDNTQSIQRLNTTDAALQAIAHYLATTPGRKNLVWFASSFPQALVPDASNKGSIASTRQDLQLKQTTDLLAAAHVALYPVAARGIETQTWNDPTRETALKAGATDAEDYARVSNLSAMDALAVQTGGAVIQGTNDLAQAVATTLQTASHFYTLSYTPSDKNVDGKFRRIDLKLADHHLHAAYRHGYYALQSPNS